jgi:hypothetical protein
MNAVAHSPPSAKRYDAEKYDHANGSAAVVCAGCATLLGCSYGRLGFCLPSLCFTHGGECCCLLGGCLFL